MTVSKQVWRRRAPRLPVDCPGRLTGRLRQPVSVVELSLTGGVLSFSVTDNGGGFDPHGADDRGTGLLGMADRIGPVGGTLV